jgi:hypothetical protein
MLSLQELAATLLLFASSSNAGRRYSTRLLLLQTDSHIDSELKHVLHADHVLAAALRVYGPHSLGDATALLFGDGGETLGLEELDAVALGAEIGFEAHEDDGGCGAEVEDFGVPLVDVSGGAHAKGAGKLDALCP